MSDDTSDKCDNCNVAPTNQEKGHSYRTTTTGIKYDVEHLNDLGFVEEENVTLLFNRMDNRLEFECRKMVPVSELEPLANKWEDHKAWSTQCAEELRKLIDQHTEKKE